MSPLTRLAVRLLFSLLPLPLMATIAFGYWPHDPLVNLKVSVTSSTTSQVVSDGAGGALVLWAGSVGGVAQFRIQHLLAGGVVDPGWPASGAIAANDPYPYTSRSAPNMIGDGAGGAIVVWYVSNSSIANYLDILAQHVRSDGTLDPAWPAGGRIVCSDPSVQYDPTLAPDGLGGAFVTWHDERTTPVGVFAHHVLASGALDSGWPANGLDLGASIGDYADAVIAADGSGGALIAWINGATDSIARVQRLDAAGTPHSGWPAGGRALSTLPALSDTPTLVGDGASGAIVGWADGVVGDLYAQHVLNSGGLDPAWPADGRALTSDPGGGSYERLVSDGAGGAIGVWESGSIDGRLYAQRVLASGAVDPAWPAGGVALSASGGFTPHPWSVPDGAGGVVVTWSNYSPPRDIFAHHVLASGTLDPGYPATGKVVCSAAGTQQDPMMDADGSGGVILAWQDARAGTSYIYAQRLLLNGYLGSPEPLVTAVTDVAGDQGGHVMVSWNAGWPDSASDPNLSAYDVYRKPGATWELAGTTSATHAGSYSLAVATTQDSAPAGNPLTAFRVIGRNVSGTIHFDSAPVSGYSVDNLAPATPALLGGSYAAGATRLGWPASGEADLANYRLYRGASAGFTPGPGNRIASPTDTSYEDPGPGGSYYKLSAVDVHGNESGFALLTPEGTAGAQGPALPREFALSRPAPNPATASATIGFVLPVAARVSLAIYDVAGRRVRSLASGMLPAGDHVRAWDLRDEAGGRLAAGLYFVRLAAGGQERVRRVVIAR